MLELCCNAISNVALRRKAGRFRISVAADANSSYERATPTRLRRFEETAMGLNSESEVAADLQIGPTDQGMVRIYVTAPDVDLPMDFEPDDALAIAEELIAAAELARKAGSGQNR